MKPITLLMALLLSGCVTQPKIEWISSKSTDRFTDKSECIVTVGSYYRSSGVYTVSGHIYPFIKKVDSELWVGVRSGGRYPLPVGAVQLRIDDNDAWIIETSETPSEGLRGVVNYSDFINLDLYPEEQQKIIKGAYEASSDATKKIMAPYTVATGEKAKKILKELVGGEVILYRALGGYGVPAAEPGRYLLDDSLVLALNQCDIEF